MDDLPLFAQTTEAAQAQVSASSAFLGAYGMTFNTVGTSAGTLVSTATFLGHCV
jgi:hypothetical protein